MSGEVAASPMASLNSLSLTMVNSPLPDFIQLDDKYKCCICKKLLQGPVMSECGHRMCRSCLESKLIGVESIPCPAKQEDCVTVSTDKIHPDFGVLQDIKRLPVLCSNKKYGCKEEMCWNKLQAHLANCKFSMVPCPQLGCDQLVSKDKLDHHVLKECLFRAEPCPYCRMNIPKKLMEPHLKTGCDEAPIGCPNKCGLEIKRKELDTHNNTCSTMKRRCQFPGCDFKGTKSSLADHEEDSMKDHLRCMMGVVMKLTTLTKKDNLGEVATETSPRKAEGGAAAAAGVSATAAAVGTSAGADMQRLEEENKQLRSEFMRLKEETPKRDEIIQEVRAGVADEFKQLREEQAANNKTIKELGVFIKGLQIANSELHDKLSSHDAFKKQMKEQSQKQATELLERIKAFEDKQTNGPMARVLKEIESRNERVAERFSHLDLRLQCAETATFSGVLLWKISGYTRRKREAACGTTVSLYSQPFYTSRYGYKMCARAYLNGDGLGKGKHLSLYFLLMKGEHDAMLQWPFSLKVSLSVLSQEKGKKHLTDSFRPDPTSSSFRRPTQEMNVASGCPLFAPQSELEKPPYLKEDSIYIRVLVEGVDQFDATGVSKMSQSLPCFGGSR